MTRSFGYGIKITRIRVDVDREKFAGLLRKEKIGEEKPIVIGKGETALIKETISSWSEPEPKPKNELNLGNANSDENRKALEQWEDGIERKSVEVKRESSLMTGLEEIFRD